jgi:hypothetical protein
VATRTLPNLAAARFNFGPLSGPIPPGVVREFRRAHRVWWSHWRQVRTVAGSVLLILFLGTCILLMVAFAGVTLLLPKPNPGVVVLCGVGLAIIAAIIAGFIGILRRDVQFGPGWNRMTRLAEFARLNNMTYQFERRDVRYNGAIFSLGTNAIATDVMTVRSGRGIQIGNYRSHAKSMYDSAHFHGGYVVIELDRRMPHMLAIAKRRRKLRRNQSIAPGLLRNQILSLEGDFDRYFTLYAPREYERDALYVFTPDLMVLLIDRLASFDLEIVDNRLYIYSHAPFDLLDPQTHERLASIVQVVGSKAANQTMRYSDDRTALGVDMVAPGGLRLRRGVTAGAVVGIVYIALRLYGSFHGF